MFYVVAVAGGGICVGSVFIEKNATARSIVATQMRIAPTAIIVRTAPMSSSSPVVPKSPTPVFSDRDVNDFRKNMAATTTNMNNMIKLPKMPAA